MPDPPSVMNAPRHSSAAGWSLVELLVVVAVMGFVASVLAGAMHGLAARHRAKEAANQFQVLVREASALAKREMTPVRLAFILPDSRDALKQAGIEEDEIVSGCRLLMFKVPGRHLPVQSLQSPVEDMIPGLPVARMPRFESMTGGWAAVPNRRSWLQWEGVEIGGDFADDYAAEGFEAVAKKFQFQPESTWADTEGEEKDPFSIYPEDFSLSPYRDLRSIVNSALPKGDEVALDGTQRITAEEVFGKQEVPHWSERTGDSKADRVELPAIDFMPDGSLVCREDKDLKELEFRFGDEGQKSHWIVKVRTADAEVWME